MSPDPAYRERVDHIDYRPAGDELAERAAHRIDTGSGVALICTTDAAARRMTYLATTAYGRELEARQAASSSALHIDTEDMTALPMRRDGWPSDWQAQP